MRGPPLSALVRGASRVRLTPISPSPSSPPTASSPRPRPFQRQLLPSKTSLRRAWRRRQSRHTRHRVRGQRWRSVVSTRQWCLEMTQRRAGVCLGAGHVGRWWTRSSEQGLGHESLVGNSPALIRVEARVACSKDWRPQRSTPLLFPHYDDRWTALYKSRDYRPRKKVSLCQWTKTPTGDRRP